MRKEIKSNRLSFVCIGPRDFAAVDAELFNLSKRNLCGHRGLYGGAY